MQDTKRLDKDIIEAGRSGGHSCREKFSGRLNRGNLQYADEDTLWEREGMTRRLGWGDKREFRDNLNPLRRYLKSQAGRPWKKVLSDLHRAYDCRTMSGWHLFDHVRTSVYSWGEWNAHRASWRSYSWRDELYVDKNGILRIHLKTEPMPHVKRLRESRKGPRMTPEGYLEKKIDGVYHYFYYLNGCWFSVERIETIIHKPEWDWSSRVWNNATGTFIFTRQINRAEKVVRYINQRQLNKKELIRYGLKNDPTFSDH